MSGVNVEIQHTGYTYKTLSVYINEGAIHRLINLKNFHDYGLFYDREDFLKRLIQVAKSRNGYWDYPGDSYPGKIWWLLNELAEKESINRTSSGRKQYRSPSFYDWGHECIASTEEKDLMFEYLEKEARKELFKERAKNNKEKEDK